MSSLTLASKFNSFEARGRKKVATMYTHSFLNSNSLTEALEDGGHWGLVRLDGELEGM